MRGVHSVFGCLSLIGALATPAVALGPVDGHVAAVWWSHDVKAESGAADVTTDGDGPGIQAEVWLDQRFGLRAEQFRSEMDGAGSATGKATSIDLMWRPLTFSENNFLAVGLGYHFRDLAGTGVDDRTSGARMVVQGRVGVMSQLYVYGQGAFLPALGDVSTQDPQDGRLRDVKGHEYELGLSWRVAPFVAMRLGYRGANFDFDHTDVTPVVTSLQAPTGFPFAPAHPVDLDRGGASTTLGLPTSYEGSMDANGYFLGLAFNF